MKRNKNVIVNIACDAFEDTVITSLDKTADFYEEMTEKYISHMFDETPVGRAFYNVCYKRSCVLSETADTYLYNIKRDDNGFPVTDENGKAVKEYLPLDKLDYINSKFKIMQSKNIDIIRMALDATKKRGIESWLSFRMNDHHLSNNPLFNSSFHYNNADKYGVFGSYTFIDYTHQAVRNYYRNYIKELLENYDIDGIEFDFLRSCPIMSEVTCENIEIINNFLRELKSDIDDASARKGKKIQTAVRVYPEFDTNDSYGLEPVKWVCEGLTDIITLENWYIPANFDIPVEKWRNEIAKYNTNNHKYTLLCGVDTAVRCCEAGYRTREMNISLEQFKGFVSSAYQNKADGIYIFNHFTILKPGEAYLGVQASNLTYYIDDNGNKTGKEVLKEKFCSADSEETAQQGEREYVLTFPFAHKPICPITVEPRIPCSFKINTGRAVKSGRYILLLGADSDDASFSVSVNGCLTTQISDMRKPYGFVWKENEKPIEQGDHVSEMAYRIMRFELTDLSVLENGYNKFVITGKTDSKQVIRWVSVQVSD